MAHIEWFRWSVGLLLVGAVGVGLQTCACSSGDNYLSSNYPPGGSVYGSPTNSNSSNTSQGRSGTDAGVSNSNSAPHQNTNANTNNVSNTNNTNQNVPAVKVNPWVDPAQDNLSTFAIDVDTASYTYSRGLIKQGMRPPAESVRVEEFINFFDYDYDGPKDSPFLLHVDGAVSPFDDKNYVLRVAIQGKRMAASERPPMHLTFLVDVSCSMTGDNRIGLVKTSLRILLDQMRDGDTAAIATYAGSSRKVLEPTDASRKDQILAAINSLNTGGGTSMGSGMILAYEMASKSFVQGHENRVIVFSDGDANIGATSHDQILATIEKYVKQGITMTTVGYGTGNYRDIRMEQLSNKGNGNYYYIDSEDQARHVFRGKFISTMLTIAKDVKIQVEFHKDYVKAYRLVGYENRDIADIDFRNDKVDAGELGSGHTVTAIYEVKLNQETVMPLVQQKSDTPLITVRLRFKHPTAKTEDKAAEIETPVPGLNIHRPLAQGSWQLQWATAVMGFAEILRQSPYAKSWTWQQVKQVAKAAQQTSDKYHQEFIDLVSMAENLR